MTTSGTAPPRCSLGYDFTDIEDGYVGYQEPHDVDTPLRGWLAEQGLSDVALMTDEP